MAQIQGCILLVENEPLVRVDLAEGLRHIGLQVLEAATGEEATKHSVAVRSL
jgi:CheY-like chemotaxis protein